MTPLTDVQLRIVACVRDVAMKHGVAATALDIAVNCGFESLRPLFAEVTVLQARGHLRLNQSDMTFSLGSQRNWDESQLREICQRNGWTIPHELQRTAEVAA